MPHTRRKHFYCHFQGFLQSLLPEDDISVTKGYHAKVSGMSTTVKQAKETTRRLQLDNEEHNLCFLKENETLEGILVNERNSDKSFVLNKYFQNLDLLFYRMACLKSLTAK